ncbi:von Willebrand factor type A domain protein [compost metagenome]
MLHDWLNSIDWHHLAKQFGVDAGGTFQWGRPWAYWLLPVPLIVWLLYPPKKYKAASLRFPSFDRLHEASGIRTKKGTRILHRSLLQFISMWVVWVLIIVAFADPRLIGKPDKKIITSRSFLITADISNSMGTTDWSVNGHAASRWTAVRSVMNEFIQRREGDRMGLVLFASQPFLQTPFTPDLSVVKTLLNESDVGMAGQVTAIGDAIGLGIKLFRSDTLKTKVMLLLTDGVDAGTNISPLDAAFAAARDGIIIYTIGIGQHQRFGSDLDEGTLQGIAARTGGKYFRAYNHQSLEQVYKTLDQLQPIKFTEEQYKPVTELYFIPLSAALALGVATLFVMSLVRLFV